CICELRRRPCGCCRPICPQRGSLRFLCGGGENHPTSQPSGAYNGCQIQTPVDLPRAFVLPRRTIALLMVMLLGRFAPLQAQDASDIIRGQVIGPDKKPVENVTVTATSLVNQTSRTAKTNKDGRFTIIFNGGGGDYMMAYVAI